MPSIENHWRARIMHSGRVYYIGSFKTWDAAFEAEDKKRMELKAEGHELGRYQGCRKCRGTR